MSFLSTVAFLFVRLVGLALIIQDFSFLSMIVDYVNVGFVNKCELLCQVSRKSE